jgi:hypothetical protein
MDTITKSPSRDQILNAANDVRQLMMRAGADKRGRIICEVVFGKPSANLPTTLQVRAGEHRNLGLSKSDIYRSLTSMAFALHIALGDI